MQVGFTFQWSAAADPVGAVNWSRGGSGAEVGVAGPRGDRSLMGQAARCGATEAETLDGASLDTPTAGNGALRRRGEVKRDGGGVRNMTLSLLKSFCVS